MQFDITSLVIGVLVGALIGVSLAVPRVGRILANIASIAFLTAGGGFLTWAITGIASGESLRPVGWEQLNISTPVEALGVGAGLLVGGIFILILAAKGRG